MVPFNEVVGRAVQLGNQIPHFTIARVHEDDHGSLPANVGIHHLVDIVAFTSRQGEIVPLHLTVNFGSLTEVRSFAAIPEKSMLQG
jgi:hypothetical protein